MNISPASLLPFIIETPSWLYAVALLQPNVFISIPWNCSSAAVCDDPPLKPPSNGMMA